MEKNENEKWKSLEDFFVRCGGYSGVTFHDGDARMLKAAEKEARHALK